ncbi:MAG: CDP-glycerol glycerophosphotransferase family protein [Lachnospiraceae bacterium]|nr:CDP-glycerol glycerophosphotransferase family protein [Lachnospiraceae bacterium]
MGGSTKERILYWLQIFLVPLYGLSFLMPRNKRIWLFGSTFGRRFAENPRYLFLYVDQHCQQDGIRPVWISHRKEIVSFLTKHGYEAYGYHSPKGIFMALRAGVYIYDNYSKDINFWQSGGAIKINLWHGSGNKQINHDNMHDRVRHPKNAWEKWKTWLRRLSDEKPTDYVLTTSPAMQELYISAFATDKTHVIVDGQPRNDVLFPYEESGIRNLITDAEARLHDRLMQYKEEGYRLLAYMPTFRDSEKKFFDVMDLPAFNDYLVQNKLILVTKLHVKSKLKKEFEEIHLSNIVNAGPQIDLYTFLKEIDLLITDYSSVYTDYMLLDRPVVAFWYDWKEYSQDTRECYIDQEEYMPEYKAETMEELMRGITSVLQEDICREKRHGTRSRMYLYLDGKSSGRLTEFIKSIK